MNAPFHNPPPTGSVDELRTSVLAYLKTAAECVIENKAAFHIGDNRAVATAANAPVSTVIAYGDLQRHA